MREKVLELLFRQDGFLSGEQISAALHVSRAAIWKHIKALKEDGAVIEAQTKKGYRLVRLPDLLKSEYVGLWTKQAYPNIVWIEETDSTNEYAKRKAREGAPDESIFIAELQTRGKGRMERSWQANAGDAIQMSVLLRPRFEPEKAPAITFAAALGVIAAIREVCGIQAQIKWPNDVIYQGKKLCGILTEMSSDMDRVEYLVCGMGLNVNQQEFPAEIEGKAVSLRIATGEKIERVRLCASMIDHTLAYFRNYILHGIDSIFSEYCANSVIIGKKINVLTGTDTLTGTCEGFTEKGALLLRQGSEIKEFLAGEVSVRGMENYIE